MSSSICCFFFFFFQAEDGIRDVAVTGVQTCALPISRVPPGRPRPAPGRRPHGREGPQPALSSRPRRPLRRQDRKSTRLNSSHGYISYAVFCLKKKKKKKDRIHM